MVPAIVDYMAALEGAMLATSTGGDTQAALTEFDSSKAGLQQQLADTDVCPTSASGLTRSAGRRPGR